MSVIINGDTGITTPAETVQGALTTTGNTILGDASTDTLNVGNGGLVKDASGNVGIGTASPNQLLTVYKSDTTNAGIATTAAISLYNPQTVASGYGSAIRFYGDTRGNNNFAGIGGILSTGGATGSTGYLAFYTKTAEADALPTERMRIDSNGNLLFNSGYGSAATAYGCRAWVNFNGTGTVAIRASGNVSSITDNGAGNYTVNLTTAMTDANYCVVSNAVNAGVASAFAFPEVSSSSGISIQTATRAVPGTNADVNGIYVSIFR